MQNKTLVGGFLIATVLAVPVVLAETKQATQTAKIDHRYYPRVPIDPSLGVAGDHSGTYQYWKDDATVKKNLAMLEDPAQAWKLNYKHMDIEDADDFHPGILVVEAGEKLVKAWEKRKPGFIKCLSSGTGKLEGLAANYPQYDKKLKRIMTLESMVEHCAKTVLGQKFKQTKPPKENAKIATYIKSLSTGKPISIDVSSGPMKASYQRGENYFYKRVGQLNFACASCHTPGSIMGFQLRGEVPTSPFGDMAHMPTYRSAAGEVEMVHKRFMRCLKLQRSKPLPLGHPAYVDLEVFFTALSNGARIKVPSLR
jgi:L-cysteine S-thiosulfotransferase